MSEEANLCSRKLRVALKALEMIAERNHTVMPAELQHAAIVALERIGLLR